MVSQETTYWMILFLGNVQIGKSREIESRLVVIKGLDSDNCCTSLNIPKITELHTLNQLIVWCINYTSRKLFKKSVKSVILYNRKLLLMDFFPFSTICLHIKITVLDYVPNPSFLKLVLLDILGRLAIAGLIQPRVPMI